LFYIKCTLGSALCSALARGLAGAAPAVIRGRGFVAVGFHSRQQAIIGGAYGWNQWQLSLMIIPISLLI
jgi:hypothetical protein